MSGIGHLRAAWNTPADATFDFESTVDMGTRALRCPNGG